MSVFIAVPYTRPFTGTFIDSLLYSKKPTLFKWQRTYGKAIDDARNELMYSFLHDDDKPEFLLFIDNDATFHHESIYRMMMHDVPMVCGCMYTRDLPPSPTWGKFIGERDGKYYYKYGDSAKRVVQRFRSHGHRNGKNIMNAMVLPQTGDDLWPIDGCGMHFTMIRRDVVEAVEFPWFIHKGKTGAGEDFYFCRKVRELGFPIYVDESIHTGHSVGEERDFGIKQLLDYSQHIENLDADMIDDYDTFEME